MNYTDIERELSKEIFSSSFFEFFKVAYCQLHPNQPLDLNWHHKVICDRLQEETFRILEGRPREKDLIINVPFRSTKSVLVTVIWPVWSWTVHPLMKFINVSYSGDLANEHSGRSKDLINTQWFQWLYGDEIKIRHDLSGKQFYENTRGGYRKATGTGGQITGSGGDVILCFRGDQLVLTDQGQLPIAEIVKKKLEIKVLSYNFETNKEEWKSILDFKKNLKGDRKMIKIKLNGKEIVCTEDHKIYTRNRGWVEAKDLTNKDILKRWMYEEDYVQNRVQSVEYIDDNSEYVYCLEVEGNHNFFVNDVLVSNCDDPQNPQKAASEVERKNTITYYSHTLYSRLNDPEVGVRIVIQQRLHEEDLTGYLLSTRPDDHEHINIPGEITDKTKATVRPQSLLDYYQDGLFWPTRFNKKQLLSYQRSLGSLQYAGQVNQLPAPAEGVIVKRSWFPIVSPETIMRNPETEPIHFFIDSAYTAKKEGDPSAIGACFTRQNKLYIVNMTQVWMEFPDLIKFIQKYVTLHGYTTASKIKIEPKASGKSIVQQLKTISQLNVMEAKAPTDDKVTRLNASSPIAESQRICLLEGAWNDMFLDQVCSQPNAKYWDMTDVMNMMVEDQLGFNNFDFMWL